MVLLWCEERIQTLFIGCSTLAHVYCVLESCVCPAQFVGDASVNQLPVNKQSSIRQCLRMPLISMHGRKGRHLSKSPRDPFTHSSHFSSDDTARALLPSPRKAREADAWRQKATGQSSRCSSSVVYQRKTPPIAIYHRIESFRLISGIPTVPAASPDLCGGHAHQFASSLERRFISSPPRWSLLALSSWCCGRQREQEISLMPSRQRKKGAEGNDCDASLCPHEVLNHASKCVRGS